MPKSYMEIVCTITFGDKLQNLQSSRIFWSEFWDQQTGSVYLRICGSYSLKGRILILGYSIISNRVTIRQKSAWNFFSKYLGVFNYINVTRCDIQPKISTEVKNKIIPLSPLTDVNISCRWNNSPDRIHVLLCFLSIQDGDMRNPEQMSWRSIIGDIFVCGVAFQTWIVPPLSMIKV